jgi:hypothetical protein
VTPAAVALVDRLRRRGVQLVPEGDRLRYRPASAVQPDEIEALRQLKPDVLDLLRQPTAPADAAPPAAEPSAWPPVIPVLGPRQTIPFTVCSACAELPYSEIDFIKIASRLFVVPARRGTFAAYHGVPLCPAHARERARGSA